ncbi:MAG: NifB/NifX family molybdenum-iron cluster-binding protein [Spirochaetota bacterium]
MVIAIPCVERKLCQHFGHCQEFSFVSVNPQTKVVESVDYLVPPPHEPGVLPRWVAENGGTVVICGGMGSRAQQLFAQNGVAVVTGAPVNDPETVVKRYLDGSLETGENACSH